jgi:hypothetical protein
MLSTNISSMKWWASLMLFIVTVALSINWWRLPENEEGKLRPVGIIIIALATFILALVDRVTRYKKDKKKVGLDSAAAASSIVAAFAAVLSIVVMKRLVLVSEYDFSANTYVVFGTICWLLAALISLFSPI